MLTDQDVLLLKLALERELLSSITYRQVLEIVRKSQMSGGVGRALRQVGVAGEKVSALAEKANAANTTEEGVILARCDLEDALVARALENSKLVAEDKLGRARNELKGLARTGELTSLSEILVKRRWLEVPAAVELRRRARERVATCPQCLQHYIVDPEKARGGRFRCRACRSTPLEPGKGSHSAVDVARGIVEEKPPAPIESSQLVQLTPEQEKELREARERGMKAEAERLAKQRATSDREKRADRATQTFATPEPPRKETAKTGRADRPGPPRTDDDPENPATARWSSVHDFKDTQEPVGAAVASFGVYEILSEVARGGMGIIYKARRKGANRLIALKVLISGVDATPEQVERFEREGENARKLKHPNIVRIYDAGRHEGYHYIAMEFVEGTTLESQLTKGALEPRRSARIVRDVARAVDHIHKAGVIHRDLKPGNIILNEADAPKLIDFGLAKTIDRRARLTRSGAAVGTPYYMPPEQVKGENDKVGPPSDVYALGAILFEMVVGDVPYKAENPVELYHKIASGELVLPSTLREGLAEDLETIIACAMEKDPKDRYQSATELADDLERFLKGEPVTARRKTRVSKAVGKARKKLALVLLGLVAAALLVAVLVLLKLRPPWRSERALLDVEMARELAPKDREGALTALERADKDGLADPSLLDAPELKALADEPRFKTVAEHVRARR
jgi:serine/threonine protein kinase